MDQLVDGGVEVLHDRRIPRTKVNIDHMAVSSSGFSVMDAFGPRRYTLLVGRRDPTKLMAGVQRQVQVVRDALAGDPRLPDHRGARVHRRRLAVLPTRPHRGGRLEGPNSTAWLIVRGGGLSYASENCVRSRSAIIATPSGV